MGKYESKFRTIASYNGKYLKPKSCVQRFTSDSSTMQRIKSLALVPVLAATLFNPLATPVQAAEVGSEPSTEVSTPVNDNKYILCSARDGATIMVNGITYPVKEHTFIIVHENQALLINEYGEKLEGQMEPNDYTELKQLTKEEMDHYELRVISSSTRANVRSSDERKENNVITQADPGDIILAHAPVSEENDKEWLPTIYNKDGILYDGYTREDVSRDFTYSDLENDYIEQEENIVSLGSMFVNTSRDSKVPLKLRATRQITDNVLAKIPHGSTVEPLGEITKFEGRNWIHVRYQSPDGNSQEGWVVADYLTQEPVIETNATGNVTGIDVSSTPANVFEKILQNKIPENMNTSNYSYNTSQLAGDINYAFMRLGASGYRGESISLVENIDAYIDQVAVCEKLGIPYGLYFYSTSISEEEAQIELQEILEKINALKERFGELKHFKFGIVIDRELHDAKDRQIVYGSVESNTNAVTTLINGIHKSYPEERVGLYVRANNVTDNSDQILNLKKLHSNLVNPEQVYCWLVSHIRTNGNLPSRHDDDIAYIESCGFPVVMEQNLLDTKFNGTVIDVNNMHLDFFINTTQQTQTQSYTNSNQINDNVSYSFDLDDDGR